jgi:hypothetical protein
MEKIIDSQPAGVEMKNYLTAVGILTEEYQAIHFNQRIVAGLCKKVREIISFSS